MLQTKALYNLIRLNAIEDPSVKAEPWALEDQRKISLEQLYQRLAKSHIQVDKNSLSRFAEECDTPEELAEILLPDELDEKKHDELYLVLFEIWRRTFPEKQSLSIFFDELDHRILLYDQGKLESDEPIQDSLANLLEILEDNLEAGAKPQDVFLALSDFCASDLENFLYDYISDLVDGGNVLYASELIDGFAPYSVDPVWFALLKARVLASTDIGQANEVIAHILEDDLPLLMEILQFLTTSGDHSLFVKAAKKALHLLQTEEEFAELMEIVADYYRRLDQDKLEQAVQKLMKNRKGGKFSSSDPDLKALEKLII